MSEPEKKMKHLRCVVPGCGFELKTETEEELMKHVGNHAAHVHGLTEVPPDLAAKVKAAIRTE
jgi:predicted small metal-binding protein